MLCDQAITIVHVCKSIEIGMWRRHLFSYASIIHSREVEVPEASWMNRGNVAHSELLLVTQKNVLLEFQTKYNVMELELLKLNEISWA